MLLRAELAFEAGEWAAAEAAPAPPGRPGAGHDVHQRRAAADRAGAGPRRPRGGALLLDKAGDIAADTREPQWIGPLGALRAELERRAGDLDAAREAIDDALDRLDFCSQDVARMARWSRPPARASRPTRPCGPATSARTRRSRSRSAEGLIARVEACAEGERPVEAAFLATARAEIARAAGRDDPALWAAAAEAWEALGRPYRAAQAPRRGAEALLARRRPRRRRRGRRGGAGRRAGDRCRVARVRDRGLRAPRAAAAGAGRAFAGAALTAAEPAKTRSGSRRASARCWRCSPTGARTGRSARRCTWPRRPRASTSRGSSPSSTCARAPRPRRSRTG